MYGKNSAFLDKWLCNKHTPFLHFTTSAKLYLPTPYKFKKKMSIAIFNTMNILNSLCLCKQNHFFLPCIIIFSANIGRRVSFKRKPAWKASGKLSTIIKWKTKWGKPKRYSSDIILYDELRKHFRTCCRCQSWNVESAKCQNMLNLKLKDPINFQLWWNWEINI